jgi:glutathione S-transferase
MKRVELTGLAYSPWTERARWALDHHRIDYRYAEHVPLLGEPVLRWKARRAGLSGRTTVPLLRGENTALMDSMDIIRWADVQGSGESLRADSQTVADWLPAIEDGLSAVRARVTAGVLADRAAQVASAKAAVPDLLAGVFAPVAVQGARFIARKHRVDLDDREAHRSTCRSLAERMRKQIGGRTFADGERIGALDLLFCSFLQGIGPVGAPWMPLDPAIERVWTDAPLAEEFGDLLAWRDRLYSAHRTP